MGIAEDAARRRAQFEEEERTRLGARERARQESARQQAAIEGLARQYRDWAIRRSIAPDFTYGFRGRKRGWVVCAYSSGDSGGKTESGGLVVRINEEGVVEMVGRVTYDRVYQEMVDNVARSGKPWP